jgi:hypothetical protein
VKDPAANAAPIRFGPYVLLKPLGRGAMGDVHLARHVRPPPGLPDLVVVKRLLGELHDNPSFVARFGHEARIAVTVDHPQVVRVFDVGAVGEALYIGMEYVAGWPLVSVLEAVQRSGRHASVASVLELFVGGLEGLAALHGARDPETGKLLGVVHRDLSAKNLMVGEDARLHLIDLGLGTSNLQEWRTRTGAVMGSLGYMAPEQARGERVDARADLYSMGVALYELLALRPYVKRGPMAEMLAATLTPNFVPPSSVRPDVPRALDEVLARALAPDREARFQDAQAFLEALRAIVPAGAGSEMQRLVDELFGAETAARRAELERLAAWSLRFVDDEPEQEGTRVFATRVTALSDPREESTAMVARRARRTSSARRAPVVEAMPTRADPRLIEERPGLMPELPTATSPVRGRGRAFSVGRRSMVALLGASGALLAVVIVAQLGAGRSAPTATALVPAVAPVVEVAARPRGPSVARAQEPVPAAPPTPLRSGGDAAPPPRTRAPIPSRESARIERHGGPEREPPAAPRDPGAASAPPPRTASPSEAREQAIERDLERLEASARRLRGEREGQVRQEVLEILAEISQWRRSEDLEKKAQAVASLEARLRRLEP